MWRNYRFELEEKISWKSPTGLCKRPTSQHSEKNLRNDGESGYGWLYSTKTPNQRKYKRTVWGCRGCGRIPNAEKLAFIRAKILNIWAKYAASFTYKRGSVYFPN